MAHVYDVTKHVSALLDEFVENLKYNQETNEFEPATKAKDWAARVLSNSYFGIQATLSDMDQMIMGNSYFYEKSLIIKYLAVLDDEWYVGPTQEFVDYLLSLQVGGYEMWIAALWITDQDTATPQTVYANRKARQQEFLKNI